MSTLQHKYKLQELLAPSDELKPERNIATHPVLQVHLLQERDAFNRINQLRFANGWINRKAIYLMYRNQQL